MSEKKPQMAEDVKLATEKAARKRTKTAAKILLTCLYGTIVVIGVGAKVAGKRIPRL